MPTSGQPTKKFRPGQALFQEAEMPRSVFLVLKGTISIRKIKGAAYIELARVYSNEVVGELSFFDRQPRSASAYALTEVEVAEIPFDMLDKLFQSTPPYLKAMIGSMAQRLRKADETIKRLQKQTTGENPPTDLDTSENDELDAAAVLAATSESKKDPGSESSGGS
ncbi:MAG: Crp/Fnr family transcriptional regulator, partial [Bdellovibrionales bacterium]|nr:Crp/Fnr family transcriptional regulator [Bdellovibrionales bacterium]